jgi:hypothetical protein
MLPSKDRLAHVSKSFVVRAFSRDKEQAVNSVGNAKAAAKNVSLSPHVGFSQPLPESQPPNLAQATQSKQRDDNDELAKNAVGNAEFVLVFTLHFVLILRCRPLSIASPGEQDIMATKNHYHFWYGLMFL